MTPDMTTRYYGHKREMAGFSHTLAILMSMLRVCLEYGWSMARVWLEAGKRLQRHTQTADQRMARVCLERLSVRSERTLSPSGADSVRSAMWL